MKTFCVILILIACGTGNAQIIDHVYFLNEDNLVSYFDYKVEKNPLKKQSKIKSIEVRCDNKDEEKAINVKHVNENWFVNSNRACTAYINIIDEENKKKTVKVLFMELTPREKLKPKPRRSSFTSSRLQQQT